MHLDVAPPLRHAWGLRVSEGTLEIEPDFAAADPDPLLRARCGRTLFDLAIRRRPGQIAFRLARRFGPAMPVRVRPSGVAPSAVVVDDHPVGGLPVSFLLEGTHEVVLYL